MCVVSMVGDFAQERWPRQYPWVVKPITGENFKKLDEDFIPRREFEALKREVEMIKELLERAKEYDQVNHEPNCELADKIALLKRVAELVGIEIELK